MTRVAGAVAALMVLAGAITATSSPAAQPLSGWQRVDLWSTAPRVLRGQRQALAAVLAPQGVDQQPKSGAKEGSGILTAPRVRALRQQPSTIGWRVRLGREPYLAFTPLVDKPPCPAIATVFVQETGQPAREAWTGHTPRTAWPAGPEVVVDLGRWANREVELQLDVRRTRNGSHACAMLWGSPEMASRAAPVVPRRGSKAPPNVLLIGADTLRADALGAWGRSPSITPALDALAAESDVWLDAFSTSNATNPSFASIHTGLYVHNHGVRDLATPLPPAKVTLAERLAAAGYDTYAVIAAQHVNPARSGLGQGFAGVATAEETSAGRLATNRALDWLQLPRTKPFFLWLHLFDPHTPHMPPAPFALGQGAAGVFGLAPVAAWKSFRAPGLPAFRQQRLAAARELYDGEVAYLDREVDRLLGFMRGRGQLDDTLVVFVADHGENLEDHGVSYRHAGLWDTTTHVPLMIRWPTQSDRSGARGGASRPPGRRLRGLVQTIDLYPTLLAAAGLQLNATDGRDLRTLVERNRGGRPAVFSDQADGQGASIRTNAWRYFVSVGSHIVPAGPYLYDLRRDPGELTNVALKGRREEAELRAVLERWQRDAKAAAPRSQLTPEEEAALRALGYD